MLMSAHLICPESRPGMEFLAEVMPLALLPFCGKSLIDHTLTELAAEGYRHINLYLSDRPELIRAQVHKGEKWGLQISYHPTKSEMSFEEIETNLQKQNIELNNDDVFTVDRFPLRTSTSLFSNYENLFEGLRTYLPSAAENQLGILEEKPGVWIGIGARVPTGTELTAPCWIGRNVYIAENVTIGANSIIEDECLIDKGVKTEQCQVAQRTYVGCDTELRESIAWGPSLVNWRTGSSLVLRDPFLLSRLDNNASLTNEYRPSFLGRFVALLVLLVSSPILLLTALFLRLSGIRALTSCHAISPHSRQNRLLASEFKFYDLKCSTLLLRRLPRLLSIVKGDMAWVGNPPLTTKEADSLKTEFDQLWLAAPCGLVSLGDRFHHTNVNDLEARTHAAYFAVKPGKDLNKKLLTWLIFGSQTQRGTMK